MPPENKRFYEFENFRLDLEERVLLRDGKTLPITPKVFQLLKILVENHGRVVEKNKLIAEIWANSFVEDGNLTFNARMLRKALGDSANNPTFIETVPRRGYRFIAEIRESSGNGGVKLATEEINQSPTISPSKKSYLPITASLVILVGLIAVAVWYMQSEYVRSESSAPILSAPFKSEKFPATGQNVHAIISPDGKYIAYTGEIGERQNIWLRKLETSENIQIVPPSDDYYFGLAFSHNGNSLYFVRQNKTDQTPASIYRVSTFGGIPAKILEKTEGWISLSPDDKQISFVRCEYKDDDFCSLMIADIDGKNERKLVTRPRPLRISDNQFSPDGESISFAVGQSWNGASEFALTQVDIASGAEREVTPRKFFDIKNLKWLPDSSGLLFTAAESLAGKWKIWQVSADTGEVKALTDNDANYSEISLDKDANKLIATRLNNDFKLYLSSSDNPNNSKVLTAALDFTFAPDGKIIYVTHESDIWTMAADGSEQHQLTNNSFSDFSPSVSPDGRFIFFCSNRADVNQVWRMNADGGNQIQITKTEGGYPRFVTPDSKWIYFESGLHQTLWRVSTEGGEEIQVSERKVFAPAFSPDGNLVAYFFRDKEKDNQMKIAVMNIADNSMLKTFAFAADKSVPVKIAWSNAGKTLTYITMLESKNLVWQQQLNTDKPHLIADLGEEEITSIAFAPDGSSFAFIGGKWIHDAVLIGGLR